jgi:hypothetical protein
MLCASVALLGGKAEESGSLWFDVVKRLGGVQKLVHGPESLVWVGLVGVVPGAADLGEPGVGQVVCDRAVVAGWNGLVPAAPSRVRVVRPASSYVTGETLGAVVRT